MDYRREIDGLRALAVVPVILFHADHTAFGGGFVGVDVFFVISGYLISAIILKELERGQFSLVNFYERRARRILPALFLVMFVCVPFAWLFLSASEYKKFSNSLEATALFFSNFFFWRQSGYFDSEAELKPLLHTWSLAVEEQYYLLFPVFLMLFWRLGKQWLLVALGSLFVVSLVAAIVISNINSSFAFFLLPTRVWELLLGAFVALYTSSANQRDFGMVTREVWGWLGLAAICYAVFSFSKETPFPGFNALLPTIGTALVVLFATQRTLVGRFIGNQFFVGVGLISYSAYLWHQPLFAFARHASLADPGQSVFLLLSLFTFVIAYFSWRYVELPFRSAQRYTTPQVFKFAAIGTIMFVLIGVIGDRNEGFPGPDNAKKLSGQKLVERNFVVLGDSHGGHLIPGLESITTGYVEGLVSRGCIPFRDVDRYDMRFRPGECAKTMNSWLDKVITEDPQAYIVISSMGPVYLDGVPFKGKDVARVTGLGVELITDRSIRDRYKVFEIGLRQTLLELSKLRNATLVFALDVPELGIDNGCSSASKVLNLGFVEIGDLVSVGDPQLCFVSRKEYDERTAAYRKLVRKVVSEFPMVLLFDPADVFCDQKVCKGYDPEFGFLYWDHDHLSEAGSRLYAEGLVRFLMLQQR